MSGSKDILIEQLRERAEKAERFNAYLLGETVYAQMQNEEETGDKIAEEIVETLMETLIEPWMGLTKEQIERCRVIIPERLPRAILCMRDLNRRLAVEEEEEKKLAAERDEAIAEAEAHNAAATQYEKDIATLRAERDEARAERDALHVALELAEVDVALDRSWCRICRTECRGAHRGRREHMHATECVLNIRAHAAKVKP